MNGILGRKIGMTRLFEESGRVIPVTVIEAGPCPVVQVHDTPSGSKAVQLGFGTRKPKRVTKALAGHVQRAGLEVTPAVLRSIDLPVGVEASAGDVVTVEIFKEGDRIKVTGTTKGRGFQGVVPRLTGVPGIVSPAAWEPAPTHRGLSKANGFLAGWAPCVRHRWDCRWPK